MRAAPGVQKQPDHAGRAVIWQIVARRSTYMQLGKRSVLNKAKRMIEKATALRVSCFL